MGLSCWISSAVLTGALRRVSRLEAGDRFLPGIRVQRSLVGTTLDLARGQAHPLAPALDLVPKKLEAEPGVDDPRLLRIDHHTQRFQDPACRRQRGLRLRLGPTGDDPVVRVPRELIASASHLLIKRGQENVAVQRRRNPTLWRPLLRRQEPTLPVAARRQRRLNQAQDPAIGHTLSNQREELLVRYGPEEIFQVRIDDPRRASLDLSPDLAKGVLGRPPAPIAKVGIIEYRLEDRLQPVEQRLLT